MITEIFPYDGSQLPSLVRCYIHPEFGLMWCAADVVKLLNLNPSSSAQIPKYAPEFTTLVPNPGNERLTLRFAAHPLVMQWLQNRIEGHDTWNLFNDWVTVRKFPTMAPPPGMPVTKNGALRGIAPAVGPLDDVPALPTEDEKQTARFHYTAWITEKSPPLRILYVNDTPWLSWADVCRFLPPVSDITPSMQSRTVKERYPSWGHHIMRVRGRNNDHVTVITPDFFVLLLRVWNPEALNAMLLPAHNGRTYAQLWADNAKAHAVDISGHRFQKTPKKVQERLFEAGTRKKEQTPDAAQQFALSQFTSLEEMQRKMKPE